MRKGLSESSFSPCQPRDAVLVVSWHGGGHGSGRSSVPSGGRVSRHTTTCVAGASESSTITRCMIVRRLAKRALESARLMLHTLKQSCGDRVVIIYFWLKRVALIVWHRRSHYSHHVSTHAIGSSSKLLFDAFKPAGSCAACRYGSLSAPSL